MVRAFIGKHALGMSTETALRRRLRTDPYLAGRLGFETIPDQSTLWRTWNTRFDADLRGAIRTAGAAVAAVGRDHDLELPGPAQSDEPEHDDGPHRDGRLGAASPVINDAERVADATQETVFDALELDRAANATIPEAAFWRLQTAVGLHDSRYINAGAQLQAHHADGVTPLGHNHRAQLRKQASSDYRAMVQDAVGRLVADARSEGRLDREVTVAIDITTGTPFYGDREGLDADVLGTKAPTDEYAYHWATIQIVDAACPLILDVRPVRRGDARAEIVADLLESAVDHVAIEVVLADREFDGDAVKQACEAQGVQYLTPTRKHTSEQATEQRLTQAGREVHVEEEATPAGPTRKTLYLRTEGSDSDGSVDVTAYEPDARQQLWNDLGETLDVDVGPDEREQAAFHHLGTDLLGDDEDDEPAADSYLVFETNADVPTETADAAALRQAVRRLVRRYRQRWEIENAYKSVKPFVVPTTSTSHALRYFNFAFACLLYNVWKLVDCILREAYDVAAGPVVPAVQVIDALRQETGIG